MKEGTQTEHIEENIWTRGGGVNRNFIMYTLCSKYYYLNDQMKEDEILGTCSTNGNEAVEEVHAEFW
jgi:hypothetical protein